MKCLLFLLLTLSACAIPKETSSPSSSVFFSPKYLERDKLFPYIYLQNGFLETIAEHPGNKNPLARNIKAGDFYWGKTQSFTSADGSIFLQIPLTFKNAGKVLAYTNESGGIIINSEEILIPPKELDQIIKTFPRFFEYFIYEDFYFVYTNFAGKFLQEITNIKQIEDDRSSWIDALTAFEQYYSEVQNGKYASEGITNWQGAVASFSNFHTPKESSLRCIQVINVYFFIMNLFYNTTDLKQFGSIEALQKKGLQEFSLGLLPQDNIKKYYISILNLLWLMVPYDSEMQRYGEFFLLPRDSYYEAAQGLLHSWPDLPNDKEWR